MKKIIFFHPYFYDGGVEKTNIRLAKGFIGKGYLVDFLCLKYKDNYIEEIKKLGINLINIRARKTIFSIFQIRTYLKNELKKYEKVIFISCQNFVNIISIFIVFKLKVKLILSERSHISCLNIQRRNIKKRILYFLIKKMYKYSDIIIANSKESAKELSKVVSREVLSIYNPVISNVIYINAEEKIEDDFFYNSKIILGIGRLEKEKNFIQLIKATEELSKRMDNIKLLIIGEGKEKENLERYILKKNLSKKIKIMNFQKNPYKFLKKADVFVLSSLYEGLPNILIEAVALRVPCVSNDCKSGPKEILLDGKGGELVKTNDYIQMASSIKKVLLNKKETEIKVEVAFKASERFKSEKIINEYLEVIES